MKDGFYRVIKTIPITKGVVLEKGTEINYINGVVYSGGFPYPLVYQSVIKSKLIEGIKDNHVINITKYEQKNL